MAAPRKAELLNLTKILILFNIADWGVNRLTIHRDDSFVATDTARQDMRLPDAFSESSPGLVAVLDVRYGSSNTISVTWRS